MIPLKETAQNRSINPIVYYVCLDIDMYIYICRYIHGNPKKDRKVIHSVL